MATRSRSERLGEEKTSQQQFTGAFLVLLIIWFKISSSYWERRGVPGPKPWPIVGNIGAHLRGKKTLGEVFADIYKKYEGYPFVGTYKAITPVLLLRDPDFVNHVLVKDFKSFRYNEFYADKDADPLFGNNPFVLRDQAWKDTRQMLTPGLTSGRMKNMYPLLKKISENFIKFIQNHPTATTDGIETRGLTKRLTLDYVAKTAFGIDGKSFSSYDDISEFNKLVNQFFAPGSLMSLVLVLVTIFPFLTRIIPLKFVGNDVKTKLMQIIVEVVKHRKDNNVQANDYLQFLIELEKEKHFGDLLITSHACTLFIDGYETSSLVLSFLLLNLARHPEYQEKIREDIKKYENENNGELTYEAVHEMPWLNACFYESLRYTPPVDILSKLCTEHFEYTPSNPDFNKLTVKLAPGDTIMIPYGFLATDDKYFDNARTFKPERMLGKNSFNKAFFPFGDGPRACIGQRLGLMQVKLGAADVLKHFELSVSPKLQQPMTYISFNTFNEVKGGFWINYKKIDN